MPNPCRQRSFWARIKLSKQKFLKKPAQKKPAPFFTRPSRFNLVVKPSYEILLFNNSLRLLCSFFKNFKAFSGSSHYSIFKDHSLLTSSITLSSSAMVCNLARFFRLSNRFLDFFQTFFSTAPPAPVPPGSGEAWGRNISHFLRLSNQNPIFFGFFQHRRLKQPRLSSATDQ